MVLIDGLKLIVVSSWKKQKAQNNIFFRITKKVFNNNDDFGYFYLTSYHEKMTESSKNNAKLISIKILRKMPCLQIK